VYRYQYRSENKNLVEMENSKRYLAIYIFKTRKEVDSIFLNNNNVTTKKNDKKNYKKTIKNVSTKATIH